MCRQLVCIGPAGRLIVPEGAEAMTVGGLAAVTIGVDRTEFTGEAGERNLADVAWLGPRALAHERLIAAARGEKAEPVLPARFGALFVSDDSLRRVIERHSGTIAGFLGRVCGRDEWSVKVVGDAEAAARGLAKALAAQRGIDAGAPGARYLLMRKIEREAQERADAFMADRGAGVLQELSGVACEHRLGRSGQTLDDGARVVASASLLVERGRAAELERLASRADERVRGEGLSVRCVGPLAPYSFAPALED
jgi:hypothetical protein